MKFTVKVVNSIGVTLAEHKFPTIETARTYAELSSQVDGFKYSMIYDGIGEDKTRIEGYKFDSFGKLEWLVF